MVHLLRARVFNSVALAFVKVGCRTIHALDVIFYQSDLRVHTNEPLLFFFFRSIGDCVCVRGIYPIRLFFIFHSDLPCFGTTCAHDRRECNEKCMQIAPCMQRHIAHKHHNVNSEAHTYDCLL